MTWTTPPTKAVGDVLFAADVNALAQDVTFLNAPPVSSWYANAATTVPPASMTPIKFNTLIVDQDPTGTAIYNPSTGIFTIRTPGVYDLDGQITFLASNTSGIRQGTWLLNGTQISQSIKPGSATAKLSVPCVSPQRRLAVGDQLYIGAFQTSGGSTSIDNQTQGTYGELRYVSA